MPITTTDFPALVDDLESIFNERARVKLAESKGMELFDVQDSVRKTHQHLVLHGVGGIREVAEGADFPSIATDEGDNITFTQRQFAAKVAVTKQMRLFDLHDQIVAVATSIIDDAFDKIDQSMADVLTYGTSTSYTDVYNGTVTSTGPDSLALFSTAHTNGIATSSRTYSNVITNSASTANVALARDPIVQTRANAMVYKDPNGIVRPVNLDTLIVSPKNEDLAKRILFSDQMSGTGNNDTNPLKGAVPNLIVWPRLNTRSDGTDTSNYWFLADSSKVKNTLKAFFAERPALDAPEQVFANKNWEWTLDYLYSWGFGFQAYLFGSTGVN